MLRSPKAIKHCGFTTGTCDARRYCTPTEFPLQNPFAAAPTNEQVTRDLDAKTANHYRAGGLKNMHVSNVETDRRLIPLTDFRTFACETNVGVPDQILYLPIFLTDSCSLYTAILRIQPRSEDRCAKIILNYLRDLQSLLRISYIDAPTNLAEVETKHTGPLNILSNLCKVVDLRCHS